MFGFEILISLLLTLIVGYLSIVVSLFAKLLETEKSERKKSPNQKIIIVLTVVFFICLCILLSAYFIDSVHAAFIQFADVFLPVVEYIETVWAYVMDTLVPFNGNMFQLEGFGAIYWAGYLIQISAPVIYLLFFAKHVTKKTAGDYLLVLFVCYVFFWIDYIVCFGIFNALIEFSLEHVTIALLFCSLIITCLTSALFVKLND